MNYISAELDAGEFSPIVIGNSGYARSISRRFFNRYGIFSHIFCERSTFLKRLSITSKFHQVDGFDREELLLIALEDFANSVQDRDIILYLIPGTSKAAHFIRRNRAKLESYFLVASPETMLRLLRSPAK